MPVVNLRSGEAFDLRIDRQTRWGNPYPIIGSATREQVIELYKRHLWTDIKTERIKLEELAALHDKTLACWCAPEPCHGDVLLAAAAWASEQLAERNES